MNLRLRKNLSLLTLLSITPLCHALSSDTQLPYQFKSDSIIYKEKQHQTIYVGHVHIKQGSTQLSGNRVFIQYKNGKIEKLVATGNPAYYSTLPDRQQSDLLARAKTITFYPTKKTVLLEHDAKVTEEKNIFTGPHIWYDIVAGIVTTTPKNNQKTVIIIQPQDAQ